MSSPNLFENGVDNLSLSSYLIEILQRIFIFGAFSIIFKSSSIVSAVVNEIPCFDAHSKSAYYLTGFE